MSEGQFALAQTDSAERNDLAKIRDFRQVASELGVGG